MSISLNITHLRAYTIYTGNGRTSPIPNGLLNLPTNAIHPSESISNQSLEQDKNETDSSKSASDDSDSISNQSSEDGNEIDSVSGELPKRVYNSLYCIKSYNHYSYN